MRMLRYRLLSILFLMLFVSGCVTGAKVKNEIDAERERLKTDISRGALKCAPYDLARAQSQLEFAEIALEEGDLSAAQDYLSNEKIYAAEVSAKADSCIPKDKDEDGVKDAEDRCPLNPGPYTTQGCPDYDGDRIIDIEDKCPKIAGEKRYDGCPDSIVNADNDGDGIPDKKDQCPFDPEDKDGFEDSNGCPDPDNDKDQVMDSSDKCPLNPGPATNQGCPFIDGDGDGVPDEVDTCPEQKEDQDGFEDHDGCPDPDNDQDGLPDKEDKCPDDKGMKENLGCPVLDTDKDKVPDVVDKCKDSPEDRDGFEDEDGCPDPDNDKDEIPDVEDKCPNQPGPVEQNGCPKKYKLIVVTSKKIELKQKVFFRTGKAVIERSSFSMLKEVADAIKSTPSIKKVVVEGHTDNTGSRKLNLALSEKRAQAVKEFLADEGVEESRLEAKGFGPDEPISSNRTRAGRAKNRRVEFKIVQ